jgi:hypothetical protein
MEQPNRAVVVLTTVGILVMSLLAGHVVYKLHLFNDRLVASAVVAAVGLGTFYLRGLRKGRSSQAGRQETTPRPDA